MATLEGHRLAGFRGLTSANNGQRQVGHVATTATCCARTSSLENQEIAENGEAAGRGELAVGASRGGARVWQPSEAMAGSAGGNESNHRFHR